jgi:RHS repeat-associated protein
LDLDKTGTHVDIVLVGDLPVILVELNAADDSIVKSYVYANGQILMQQSGLPSNRYFYLHDRLGNIRQIVSYSGSVAKYYTYNPFGETLESGGTLDNPFLFTGQYYDSEIAEYYLRARQYDPHIGRFTARDPVFGKFEEPLTLHRYLYCQNNPANRVDPIGLWDLPPWLLNFMGRLVDHPGYVKSDTQNTLGIMQEARTLVGKWWQLGPILAFGIPGYYDYKGSRSTFQLYNISMKDSEFGNFLAGYTSYYNYAGFGDIGVRGAGHADAFSQKLDDVLYNNNQKNLPWFDDPGSKYFISAGILRGREDRAGEGWGRGTKLSFALAKYDLFYGYERIADNDPLSDEYWQEIDNLVASWNYCTE